jgi:hypothetical protein
MTSLDKRKFVKAAAPELLLIILSFEKADCYH